MRRDTIESLRQIQSDLNNRFLVDLDMVKDALSALIDALITDEQSTARGRPDLEEDAE